MKVAIEGGRTMSPHMGVGLEGSAHKDESAIRNSGRPRPSWQSLPDVSEERSGSDRQLHGAKQTPSTDNARMERPPGRKVAVKENASAERPRANHDHIPRMRSRSPNMGRFARSSGESTDC